MADISFDPNGRVIFPTKYHGDVTLSNKKWDEICSEPERFFYRHNGEKVPTTLIAPDVVMHHKHITTQFIYYKRFETFKVTDKAEGSLPCKLMAVIIDTSTQRVCTVYPTNRPKPESKEYRTGGS